MTADADVLSTVGRRIAQDLLEQAALPPRQAAHEAGCGTDREIDAWVALHADPVVRRPGAPARG